MENGLLHNFDMVHNIVVPIQVMVPAPAGTSDSRSNVPVPVSGVEEGKKTDTDTDSGAGITSPLATTVPKSGSFHFVTLAPGQLSPKV